MRPFWHRWTRRSRAGSRSRGRHALGAAVPAVASAVAAPPAQVPPTGRVQLGFRDGTTAALDPDSAQALALEELAGLLNLRALPRR